jgi:hypothetical protein
MRPPSAFVRLLESGLSFPGRARVKAARSIRLDGGYYVAGRILSDRHKPVGTGIWATSKMSFNSSPIALNEIAAKYSDWRAADTPVTSTARLAIARLHRCLTSIA